MMQTMRHLAQSWLFKGLMLIFVISFGIWGIGDIFRGNPLQRTVATTAGVSITVQDLTREFDAVLVRARQAFGPELTAEQAKQIGLLDTALNGLIERAEIDREIERLGIIVNDRAVLDEVLAQQSMRTKDGTLDRDKFQQLLANAHLSEAGFSGRSARTSRAINWSISFSIAGRCRRSSSIPSRARAGRSACSMS